MFFRLFNNPHDGLQNALVQYRNKCYKLHEKFLKDEVPINKFASKHNIDNHKKYVTGTFFMHYCDSNHEKQNCDRKNKTPKARN